MKQGTPLTQPAEPEKIASVGLFTELDRCKEAVDPEEGKR
jgi:hypothetical protein